MKRKLDTLVREMMTKFIASLRKDGFDLDELDLKQPLRTLLPETVSRAQHVERKFVTAVGRLWERIATTVGESRGYAENGRTIVGVLGKERSGRITDILEGRRPGTPNWDEELEYVMAAGGELQEVSVTCDLFISPKKNEPGVVFELKSTKPNKDQAKIARGDLLTLYAMEPRQVEDAYLGLPFNPFGERSQYNWPHIKRFFDVKNDRCLLIGRELWEKVGREEVLDELLEVSREIGTEFHREIQEICLDMASPDTG